MLAYNKNYMKYLKKKIKNIILSFKIFRFGVFKWLLLRGEAKYAYFQKHMYEYLAKQSKYSHDSKEDLVVGTYDLQNEWKDYDDYILKYVDESYKQKLALDFATGPGRNIIKYHDRFLRLDGVDISEKNIENAKENLRYHKVTEPVLYVNNGMDLSEIPSETYDFIMSTIALQHICVYTIRLNLLKEFYRVLKPGGRISLQMGYGSDIPNSVPYYGNDYAALLTNGHHDTQIESADYVKKDLEKIGFIGFEYWLRPSGPKSKQKEWIYFTALK